MSRTESQLSGIDTRPWNPFWIRSAKALLTLLPFAYLGLLLATAVHEVLGHGLAAVCLGGRFFGFKLDWSGMGWAWTCLPAEAGAWKHCVVLAAGVVATITLGTVFLACGAAVRRPMTALVLLVLGANHLLEGAPYVFWNSVYPLPPGDIGMILSYTSGGIARAVIIGAGGVVMVGAIWLMTVLLFNRLERWVGQGGQLKAAQRVIVAVLVGMVPAAMWFTFDWNLLAPGAGVLPCLVGAGLHVAAAALVLWRNSRNSQAVARRRSGNDGSTAGMIT